MTIRTLLLGCLVAAIAGCDSGSQEPTPQSASAFDSAEPVRVSVVQRTSEPVPGLDDQLHIHIDDITGGQVLVRLTEADYSSLLPNTAMREGQSRLFRYQEQDFNLRLVRLHNYVAGDDYAEFEISRMQSTDSAASVMTETTRIEHLIRTVETLENAAFVRNGKEYTPAEAAKHMRDKWEWKSGEITTAEEFIRVAASKSSISGDPYRIRFDDGREITSGDYLRGELRKLQED